MEEGEWCCFEQRRVGDSAVVGHEDIEGSSIAEVSVSASSTVPCTGVVITSLTSGDDCGTDIQYFSMRGYVPERHCRMHT